MAVKHILKLISLINYIMYPMNGVAYGRKSIFLSLTAKTLLSSYSIVSAADALVYHCLFSSANVSTNESFKNEKSRPFVNLGYFGSCLASFGVKLWSTPLPMFGVIVLLFIISRPIILKSLFCFYVAGAVLPPN